MRPAATDLPIVRLLLKTWLTGHALSGLAALSPEDREVSEMVRLATNMAEAAVKRLEPDIAELARRVEALVLKQVVSGELPQTILDPSLFKDFD